MSSKPFALGITLEGNERSPLYFARHDTFHPRFGWLKKGYDAGATDWGVFSREDGPFILGVGKNMVKAIRYWCKAFKVLGEDDRPTEWGRLFLGEKGLDPYLEDPASLWWFHWLLFQPPCLATSWEVVFNQVKLEFSSAHLLKVLLDYQQTIGFNLAESSFKKDISCLLRMYCEQDGKGWDEDSIDSPFVDLLLIQGDAHHYSFNVGAKQSLPAEIIVAACLDYSSRREHRETMPLGHLAYKKNSPGVVFKLSEWALMEAIEKLQSQWSGKFSLMDTAGLLQFSYSSDPQKLAKKVLRSYYQLIIGN